MGTLVELPLQVRNPRPQEVAPRRLVMLLMCFPLLSEAQYQFRSEARPDGTVAVHKGQDCPEGDLVIPEVIEGRNVAAIGGSAFAGCFRMTRITIPDTVTVIGDGAFNGCSGMTSVVIGNRVISIGREAFHACEALSSLTLPDSVRSIKDHAFSHCTGLTNLSLGTGVEKIGAGAFSGCRNLTSVILPDSVVSLGIAAFAHCTRLTGVAIPDGVVDIPYDCFNECISLTHVAIGAGVTTDIRSAFLSCSRLEVIDVSPHNPVYTSVDGMLATDGGRQLVFCPKGRSGEVHIPDTVAGVDVAFRECSRLTSVAVPNSITRIDAWSFERCTSLTNVLIGSGVTYISENAFPGCGSLEAIDVAPSNRVYISVNGMLFIDGGRTLVLCPEGKTDDLRIPEGVTAVQSAPFRNCTRLTSVTLPESLTNIMGTPFHRCSRLEQITVADSNPSYRSVDGILFDKDRTRLIQCPGGKVGAVTVPDGVARIGGWAFSYCHGVTTVDLGSRMTSIGDFAFGDCKGLTHITIPNSVTNIGSEAFKDCIRLKSISIPDAVSSVGEGAFDGCRVLTNAYINTRRVESSTFATCIRLTDLILGTNVAFIGYSAFASCESLRAVTIPDNVTTIDSGAFYDCYSLAHVDLPRGLSSIGESAFRHCAMTNVLIPGSVEWLGDGAFSGCWNLASAYFEGHEPGRKTWFGALDPEPRSAAFDETTVLYHLPHMAGWSTTGDWTIGSTTAIWRPYIKIVNPISGAPAAPPRLEVRWARDRLVAVEACSDLTEAQWQEMTVVNAGGGERYQDNPELSGEQRFYRGRCLGWGPDGNSPLTVNADGTLTIAGAPGTADVVVPERIEARCVTRIGPRAFANARHTLKTVSLPDGVNEIGTFAFFGCTGLGSVTIPDSVTSIGDYAFYGCSSLATVHLGRHLRSIGTGAFYSCTNLADVYFAGPPPGWDDGYGYNWFLDSRVPHMHYLPGAQGWDDRDFPPTAPWVRPNPSILDFGDRFGPSANGFSFVISWATNVPVVVEASADLRGAGWTPISTNVLTDGWVQFTDPDWSHHPARFYRVRGQ